MSAARCVWLTEAEYRDWKKGLGTYALDAEQLLEAKWGAAPADATEAVARAIWEIDRGVDPTYDEANQIYRDEALDDARDVLAALGAPA